MRRGFEAVLQDLDALAAMGLPDLLKAVGTKLVMKVGGASGPLYGTLFLALGKALPDEPSREEAAAAFAAAIAAVRARGKSERARRPCSTSSFQPVGRFPTGGDLAAVRKAAADAAEATAPMRATRGRASFLGERSIGHMSIPARGRRSLMIAALCDELGEA